MPLIRALPLIRPYFRYPEIVKCYLIVPPHESYQVTFLSLQKRWPYYRGTTVCIVTQCYIYGYQFKHLLSQSQKNYDKKMSIQNRKKYWQVFVKTMIFSQKRLTKICRKLIKFFLCFVDCCFSFCTFSFGIYRFWLLLWYLQTLLNNFFKV